VSKLVINETLLRDSETVFRLNVCVTSESK